jgi:hypothetical protein
MKQGNELCLDQDGREKEIYQISIVNPTLSSSNNDKGVIYTTTESHLSIISNKKKMLGIPMPVMPLRFPFPQHVLMSNAPEAS